MSEEREEGPAEVRDLIWSRPQQAAKGPAQSRSRAQIAAAAVALADAEGPGEVSMRKLAVALGIATASLYGYVDSKDELYDLMVDQVEGEGGPPPAPSGDWRRDLTYLAHRSRRAILGHPWMAGVAAGRPNFGPHSLAWVEYGLAAMGPLELGIDEMLTCSEMLQAFVRGFTTRELAQQQALKQPGTQAAQYARALTRYIESVLESEQYPWFSTVVRDAHIPHAPDPQELLFTSALDKILDSISRHEGSR